MEYVDLCMNTPKTSINTGKIWKFIFFTSEEKHKAINVMEHKLQQLFSALKTFIGPECLPNENSKDTCECKTKKQSVNHESDHFILKDNIIDDLLQIIPLYPHKTASLPLFSLTVPLLIIDM